MGRGLLHVTILNAKDLPKQERFGKQPCYCIVQLGNSTTRSKVCKDGGQCPTWNETMFLQLGNEQHITFTVFVERLLMKDVEIGTVTYALDQVIQAGTDEVQLRLSCDGRHQGTLSINLELRSTGGLQTRSGSSGSSLASPLSSSSLAVSLSGSLGSGTGLPGLKASSLPIMLQQQPNLALYRELLLQQSVLLTHQAQQQQQQQQQQQWAQQARHTAGPSAAGGSSTGGAGSSGGAGTAGAHKPPQWEPKRTAADLFADPSSIHDASALPQDLLGMFGAADSSFSGFDSSAPPAQAAVAVDALRVQALVDAVYGGTTTNQAGGSTVSATAAATAGSRTAGVADVMPYGILPGGRVGLCPPISEESNDRQMGSNTGGSQAAGMSVAGAQSSSGTVAVAAGSYGSVQGKSVAAAGAALDAGTFDPFQAAACEAAAAVAGDLSPSLSSVPGDFHMSNTPGAAGQQPSTSVACAAADDNAPQPFSMAAIQAAAAAFAAATAGSEGPGSSSGRATNEPKSDGVDRDVFPRSDAGYRPQPPSAAAGLGASAVPDPFGFGGAAAAAAALAAAGEAPAARTPPEQLAPQAAAGTGSSSSWADGQHLSGGGTWGAPRKWSAVTALQPVEEVSESFPSGGIKAVEVPGAAATADSQQLSAPLVLQDLAEVSCSPRAVDNSAQQALLTQSQQQVALLTQELKERDLLVNQLRQQLSDTQRQLQQLRSERSSGSC